MERQRDDSLRLHKEDVDRNSTSNSTSKQLTGTYSKPSSVAAVHAASVSTSSSVTISSSSIKVTAPPSASSSAGASSDVSSSASLASINNQGIKNDQ